MYGTTTAALPQRWGLLYRSLHFYERKYRVSSRQGYGRFVWHAAFEQEQQAKELRNAIRTTQQQLLQAQYHQCLGTAAQRASVKDLQQRLTSLLDEYQTLTGEGFDEKEVQWQGEKDMDKETP